MKKLLYFFSILLLLSSCKKEEETPIAETPKEIIHIGHTKTDQEGEIVDVLQNINFSEYQLICHGGDVDQNTSTNEGIMEDWNDLFDFGSQRTLWTLGNHDVDNRNIIQQYTNRESYYAYTFGKTTFLVLDTQLDESTIIDQQLELFNNVCDTISDSSSLVILTHLLFWLPDNDELEPQIDDIANGKFGTCFYCTKSNNFYDDLYPRLKELRDRGIQVLCIAGDLGVKLNQFEYQTEDGIFFLASGLDFLNPDAVNQVLLLHYNDQSEQLEWEFEAVESL